MDMLPRPKRAGRNNYLITVRGVRFLGVSGTRRHSNIYTITLYVASLSSVYSVRNNNKSNNYYLMLASLDSLSRKQEISTVASLSYGGVATFFSLS